jgi:hypothetical protein
MRLADVSNVSNVPCFEQSGTFIIFLRNPERRRCAAEVTPARQRDIAGFSKRVERLVCPDRRVHEFVTDHENSLDFSISSDVLLGYYETFPRLAGVREGDKPKGKRCEGAGE